MPRNFEEAKVLLDKDLRQLRTELRNHLNKDYVREIDFSLYKESRSLSDKDNISAYESKIMEIARIYCIVYPESDLYLNSISIKNRSIAVILDY